jgi:mannobiose 2-epimerase
VNGGYFWKTDLAGNVTNDRKIVYGQAFMIYALAEYVRASGDLEALRAAQELYQTLQKHAHDAKNGGWMEHFQRDWQPILKPEPGAEVEVPGYKSANTHLHLMEALAELAEVTNDDAVKKSLSEALRLNVKYFYPKQPGKSCFHRQPDWKPVTDPKSAGLSYGQNVEFAWLMVRAEAVLNRKPSWSHFEAHLRHALNYGFDQYYGGVFSQGTDDQPATDTDKIWWVQAEMLTALTVAVQHRAEPVYVEALDKLLEFIRTYQADPTDGIWLDTVTADGKPKNTAKAHNWKANYHDVRALVKFVETFPPSDQVRKVFRNR